MKLPKAIKILKEHQEWRLGSDTKPTDPKQLTQALEVAINLLEQLKN